MPKSKSHKQKPSRSFLMGLSLSVTMVFALAGFSLLGLNQSSDTAQASSMSVSAVIANTNQESIKNLALNYDQNRLNWSGFYFSDNDSCQQVETSNLEIINQKLFLDVVVIESDDCAEFGDILEFSGSIDTTVGLTRADLENTIVEIR